MLPIKKGQEATVEHIILAASRGPITPENIKLPNQSHNHITLIFEQLAFFGYLQQLENGKYTRT
ncbi:hypothetical protein PVK64_14595 [Aliivibrio sp. S4TY2]|uniref:hypothetical protein n=1 Tax=unclassified Aliivibrio TaxID=2645654 RepID=UPI002378115C|nr:MULTISPECIES: hypothetical protein [unclassified Aliivibrio]MDD9157399.1 hypothetical protein [Aliivibrio sp. S4TY2]MDD9161407.1 hypothetical protein [Aliivibrio sp. S4TY1]MDD9165437.1 hypothetical protein [Aliivibrio sp. S4MY2]MDD9169308.1 hypothetical protein [Aliivibrio sp. S4MY4]MDD9186301.1 hypothetical protein [Aliivibrio sp. S4MY3]